MAHLLKVLAVLEAVVVVDLTAVMEQQELQTLEVAVVLLEVQHLVQVFILEQVVQV